MRVFKFYPAKWAHQTLSKRRLKVSPVDELNDPFEYLSLDVGDRDVRTWAREFRKTVSQANGIISFSRNWRQPLLWAHYADSHRGIALGFDVPDHLLFEIKYLRNRIKPPSDVDSSPKAMEDLIYSLLSSKHKEWAYEEEYRLVRPLANCLSEDGKYFAPLNETTILREVILGARYESAGLSELQTSLMGGDGICFQTARAEFKGFRMTPQQLAKLQKKL